MKRHHIRDRLLYRRGNAKSLARSHEIVLDESLANDAYPLLLPVSLGTRDMRLNYISPGLAAIHNDSTLQPYEPRYCGAPDSGHGEP